MVRRLSAFVGAVVVTFFLGATFATLHVQGNLTDMGASLSVGERLQHVLHDWWGMGSGGLFPGLIAVGLAIGFVVAALILRVVPNLRTVGYALAGLAAMLCLHWLLHATFGMHPIAATREMSGLLLQGVAGLVGGVVFARWGATRAEG